MPDEERQDLGTLVYSVRPLPRATPVLIAVAVVVVMDAAIYLGGDSSLMLVGFGTLGALLVMVPAVYSGYLELHRVYEHAVVVGLSWPRTSPPYVIALSSIDPSSVTVHVRANMIARRLQTQGSPTMRMAIYSTRAVSFIGRSWQTSNAALDPSSPSAQPAKRRLLELRQAAFTSSPLPAGPTSLWALGVRDPQPLLEALEAAFAADGRPQPGLAQRALLNPVIEPSGEPLHAGS